MARSRAAAKVAEENTQGVQETPAVAAEAAAVADTPKKDKESIAIRVKELKPTDYITVRNGFAGRLVYKSKRTGEKFVWSELGDEQDIELQELKNAKNSAKGFFINNWFLFDDPAVVAYLGVERMYQYTLNADDFMGLFDRKPEEIEAILSKLPDGQKASLAYYARTKIASHEVDSLRVINMLEKYLDVQLIEH